MKVLKKLILLLLLSAVIVLSLALGYYLAATKDVVLVPEKLVLEQNNLRIYDSDGNTVESVSAFTKKQTVRIEEIPEHTKLAFVNVEDKRFYSHKGFDTLRIAKAIWNNVKSRSFKEGASTISQQLIKNTHLTQEKTIKRKLQEYKLTKALEHEYSKEEILEKYLNSIYFGHSCFGIYAASDFYFNKTPQELTLSDSAILAGLVKSPNRYSPFKNADNCQKRKELVLRTMLASGSITQAQKEQALQDPLPQYSERSKHNQGYVNFVFDELSSIAEDYELTLTSNVEIYTGLDSALQAEIENVAAQISDCDKTILSLDRATGNFNACVSTVGNIRRLPGSLIKPLLVYTPALEENILSPATPILDEKVDYNGYRPENYDGTFHGYQSTRECVAKSLNVPAVKVLQSLGLKKATRYLEQLGLPLEEEDYSLALALGGMRNGFTLQDIVKGYATLQNRGISSDCGFISEIVINGRRAYKRPESERRIFAEDSAYLMTDMLQTAVKTGTAKKLRALPFDIAAKTGTVGTKKGNTDAYALAYTSQNLVATWLGNADNSAISYTGGGLPCNCLLEIYRYLYQREGAPDAFVTPTSIRRQALDKTAYYDTHTMLLADDNAPAEYYFEELFKVDTLPLKKSDFFSNPSILPPTVSLRDDEVVITLDKNSPTLYDYQIDRYDYVTHTTLYCGKYLQTFVDRELEENKEYVYTVTPIYNGTAGTPVTLPAISTKLLPNKQEREMLEKKWWEY